MRKWTAAIAAGAAAVILGCTGAIAQEVTSRFDELRLFENEVLGGRPARSNGDKGGALCDRAAAQAHHMARGLVLKDVSPTLELYAPGVRIGSGIGTAALLEHPAVLLGEPSTRRRGADAP